MTHWPGNNGYSGQPEEPHLQSHDNGPGRPSASGGYPTLQPHSQVSTSSAFQQAVADRLHHNYSNLAQTGPQGLPLFQTSLNAASFNPSTSQAAFAYGSHNSQHAASGSQHQHEAFNMGSAPNADAYPNYHTSRLQDFAGDSYPILSQLEPSQPGIAVPQTIQSQDPAGGSYPTLGSYLQIPTGSASHQAAGNRLDHDSFAQNAPRELPLFPSSLDPTSFDRSTGQAGSAYDSRNPQHAIGIQDQHGAFDIGSVPNHDAIAYPDYHTSHSQDTHDGFVPQNIPQGLAHFPTDLNPTRFEPSMSQDQSSSSALGAYCLNDPDSLYSEDYIATLGQKRPSYRKISHPYKGVPFVRSDTPPPSALSQSTRKTSTLQVESAVIDRVKEDASRFLNLSLFQSSLYPSLTEVDKFATAALNRAIGEHPKNVAELKAWKLRPEGQKFLSRLKGNVRKLHKDCSQGCARGLVTGTYDLSLQLLFANTNEIAPSRSRHALALLSNNDYLDIVVQRVMSDGQLKSFRVPMSMLLILDKPNWALGLRNTILLAATICKWKIWECSKNGWFQITDFHTSENEASYTELKGRMSSLLGSELEEFYGLLSCLCDLLLTLPVC
ncbi:uncharacterized protein F5891DRAFT_1191493 [Suillus fuscotomentosus]|uniref:Uncharacterized protein n=1 Tax=Suillus fuscotomentosus TaxID=1912939 RepID=A0AAD4HIL7_9AGAM|nr:uncharacterized protein F5891DRAFT_1191493 [Suillus fuscotomentosus]KAG1897867.1 hypothetical protein F5891DRAFT_1191493 [Suillus fuscotomentosus]